MVNRGKGPASKDAGYSNTLLARRFSLAGGGDLRPGTASHRQDARRLRARVFDRRHAGRAQERIQQRAIFQPQPADFFPQSCGFILEQAHVATAECSPRAVQPLAYSQAHRDDLGW